MNDLLGISDKPGFDAELAETELEERAGMAVVSDVEFALSAVYSRVAVRDLRTRFAIPERLGYRFEAIRIAERIFSTLEGKSFRGVDPLCEYLDERGAEETRRNEVDIFVSGTEESAATGILCFDLGGARVSKSAGRYIFSMSDLDRFTRHTLMKRYPRNMARLIDAEAVRIEKEMMSHEACDIEALFATMVSQLQSGVRERHMRGGAGASFTDLARKRFLQRIASPSDARLATGFLTNIMRLSDDGR